MSYDESTLLNGTYFFMMRNFWHFLWSWVLEWRQILDKVASRGAWPSRILRDDEPNCLLHLRDTGIEMEWAGNVSLSNVTVAFAWREHNVIWSNRVVGKRGTPAPFTHYYVRTTWMCKTVSKKNPMVLKPFSISLSSSLPFISFPYCVPFFLGVSIMMAWALVTCELFAVAHMPKLDQ